MLRYKARLIASFDNRLLGEIDAAHAKELLWSWVEAIPDRMLMDVMEVSDRKKFQAMALLRLTPLDGHGLRQALKQAKAA